MPNIKSYSAGENLGLQPSDRASSSALMAGRRIAQQYNEMADATSKTGSEIGGAIRVAGDLGVKYLEHREQSQGAAEYAKVMLGLNNAWNEKLRNTDPNDPSAAGEFHEKVLEPTLQKFREGFMTEGGQKWADHHIDSLRRHMNEKTTADMSTLAGHAAVVNAQQSINTLGSLVASSPDGHTLDMALKTQRENADAAASSPNLRGAAGARVKMELLQKGQEQIVKAAVMSAIERNQAAGLAMAKDPKYAPFITPGEIKQFEHEANYQTRLRLSEARQQEMWAKQQAQYKSDETTAAFLDRVYTPGAQPVAIEELTRARREGEMTPHDFKQMAGLIERRTKEDTPLALAKENAIKLIMDVRAGKITDNGPLYDALGKGDIDYPRLKEVQRELIELRTPEGEALGQERNKFLQKYEHVVNPPNAVGERHNYPREYELYYAARQAEERLRKKPGGNPHDVYNPSSPDYIGKLPQAQPMSPYELAEQQRNRMSEARTPPTKPPEKPAGLGEFKDEAQWDATAKRWYVTRDGKKKLIVPDKE